MIKALHRGAFFLDPLPRCQLRCAAILSDLTIPAIESIKPSHMGSAQQRDEFPPSSTGQAVMRRSVVRWREAAVEERNERARSQFRSELRKTATQTLRWIRDKSDKDGDERGAIVM